MKIGIRNLGRIERASLNIRPITLLVGENNTNKTWTAYSIYALLKSLTWGGNAARDISQVSTKAFTQHINRLASEAAERIRNSPTSASVNLEFSRELLLQSTPKQIELGIHSSGLAKVLAVPQEQMRGASVKLGIPRQQLERGSKFFFASISNEGKQLSYGESNVPGVSVPDIKLTDELAELIKRKDLTRYTISWTSTEPKDWAIRLRTLLLEFAISSFNKVVALPAERKALITLYQQLERNDVAQLPLPLGDFVDDMKQAQSYARSIKGDTGSSAQFSSDLAGKLETVLGGHVRFQTRKTGDEIVFATGKRVALPIHATSSIVRSLAGLIFSIPNTFETNSALIIDEPEMNAHPAAQLAIVEILAALANRGNYVVATTHSPYVIDHLNNLLAAYDSPDSRKKTASKFVLKMAESFLAPEMVAAYEFSSAGIVRNIMDAKRGRIESSTFGSISDSMENLYSELLGPPPQ